MFVPCYIAAERKGFSLFDHQSSTALIKDCFYHVLIQKRMELDEEFREWVETPVSQSTIHTMSTPAIRLNFYTKGITPISRIILNCTRENV